MDNKEKQIIMKELDQAIGTGEIEVIDEILNKAIQNINDYDLGFLKLMLGYVGIYQKELTKWIDLYNIVEKQSN